MASIELIDNPVDGTANPGGHFHATEFDNLTRAANGHGVVGHTESMTITGGDRVVTVPAFNALVPDGSGGTVYVEHAGGDVTIAAADGSDPRTDIGTLDSAGNLGKTDGTPTTETGTVEEAPMPALADDEILLFKVRALANTSNIGTDKVVGRAIDISENRPFVKGASDLTAASALSLPDTNERYFDVTGATGITSISTRPAGEIVILQFDSTPTLTHNSTSLILQAATDLTVVAGDSLTFVSEGSGNWREIARNVPTHLGQGVQAMVESGRAAFCFFGGHSAKNLANGDSPGQGVDVFISGTGTFDAATRAELPGGVDMFVTADGDDSGLVGPNGLAAADDWVIGCRIKQGASAAAQDFFMGLKPTISDFVDENGSLGWRLVDTGDFEGFVDDGGTETVRGSGNNDTSVHTIRMAGSGGGATIKFFFDNVQVGADVTTNIPAGTSLILMCGVTGTGTEDHHFPMSDFYAYRRN